LKKDVWADIISNLQECKQNAIKLVFGINLVSKD